MDLYVRTYSAHARTAARARPGEPAGRGRQALIVCSNGYFCGYFVDPFVDTFLILLWIPLFVYNGYHHGYHNMNMDTIMDNLY
jgi:hypothetical protein